MDQTTLPSNQATLDKQFCEMGLAVIDNEAAAIAKLRDRIGPEFSHACRLLLACTGRIVVLGMGKSGHIGNKLAATLASTGTPAFFVHPGEASHGDMGMITDQDVVVALSHSGETQEVLALLPQIKRYAIPLVALTGRPLSTLAQQADAHLDVSVEKEACPLGLAPTSSTTATLAMGDALAIALLEARGFTPQDFAQLHPGGSLGQQLRQLVKVADLMITGDGIPHFATDNTVKQALAAITAKSLGMALVVSQCGSLQGIFTDGDLRRCLNKDLDLTQTPLSEVMSSNPKTISRNALAAEALKLMQTHKISSLVVVDENKPVGLVHLFELLQAKIA